MTEKAKRTVAGNSLQEAANMQRLYLRQAGALHTFEAVLDGWADDLLFGVSVTVRAPSAERANYLVVGRGCKEGHWLVCFHDAPSFVEAVVGFVERARNGSLQWRDDKYGNGKTSG